MNITKKTPFWCLSFATLCIFTFSCQNLKPSKSEQSSIDSEISLDQEIKVSENKVINSSTQSINRYSSNLRQLNKVKLSHDFQKRSLNFTLQNESKSSYLNIENIDTKFLTPLLPYPEIKGDKFDIANLILAEYSRNGIGIPIQESNNMYAQVKSSEDLFNNKGEYIFNNGNYQPNQGVLPKRLFVINNCLRPGLWEFSASDAVGEMFHAWYEVDQDFYFELIENQTGINKESIPNDFNDPSHFTDVTLDLNRLRNIGDKVGDFSVQYNKEKVLGSYSSQDSRRKVQRKFFEIERKNNPIEVTKQEELQEGDHFSMFSFQEPGIYDPNNRMKLVFNRDWKSAEIHRSNPKTEYSSDQEFLPSDYIEIKVYNQDKSKSLIIGNIPMSLLSFKNDFIIPAFGAGVFQASEPIERRLLRSTVGPRPSFAYLSDIDENGNLKMVNNHLLGYEQLFLRPVEKEDDMFIRITLVSYERITDLMEFDINVNIMKDEILLNNKNYSPPIYQTYQDDNTL